MPNETFIQSDNLFNLSVVEQMCRGKEDKILKMIVTFVDTIAVALCEIKQAYEQLDITAIQRTAHRIKPTLAIYAITALEEEMNQLSKLGNHLKSIKDLGIWVEKTDKVLTCVIEKMKKDFWTS